MQNSLAEQDFENDLNKRNVNKKAAGQIVNSINNIYDLCKRVAVLKGKSSNVSNDLEVSLQENKIDQAAKNMKTILDLGAETVTDLVKTFQIVNIDFNSIDLSQKEKVEVAGAKPKMPKLQTTKQKEPTIDVVANE